MTIPRRTMAADIIDQLRRAGVRLEYNAEADAIQVTILAILSDDDRTLIRMLEVYSVAIKWLLRNEITISLQYNSLCNAQIGVAKSAERAEFLCGVMTCR